MSQRHAGIREMRVFADGEGRKVIQFSQVYGKNKEPDIFKGEGTMVVKVQHPSGAPVPPQQIKFEFQFPPETTLKGAFDTFDELADKKAKEWEQQQKDKAAEQRIVGARMVPKSLFGPGGKPLQGG